jgi:hypothetical protein
VPSADGRRPEGARRIFRAWSKKGISAADLGVASLDEVQPIESPAELAKRLRNRTRLPRRVCSRTTRFRHESANERLKWLTDIFMKTRQTES